MDNNDFVDDVEKQTEMALEIYQKWKKKQWIA
jgi:hypothetical protein